MKREFLEGLGLSKDIIDSIMQEHGRDIESSKSKLKQYLSEAEKAKEDTAILTDKLDEAEKLASASSERIKELESEKNKLSSMLEKLGGELKYERRRGAVEKALRGTNFVSSTAKHAVIEKLISEIPDGEDVSEAVKRLICELKIEDPQAFISEGDELPVFSAAPASDYPGASGFEVSAGFRVHPKNVI